MSSSNDQIEKKYWKIGDVAHMMNVSPSAIRYWLEYFEVEVRKRSRKGTRHFSKDEIRHVLVISHLVRREMHTLTGALIKYNQWKAGDLNLQIEDQLEALLSDKPLQQLLP